MLDKKMWWLFSNRDCLIFIRHRRAWCVDQDDAFFMDMKKAFDQSCDYRCQKVSRKLEGVFHLHFHDEGVTVGSKRVLMLEKQTEIF